MADGSVCDHRNAERGKPFGKHLRGARGGRAGPDPLRLLAANEVSNDDGPAEPSPVDGIPHINLDLALEFLLGDRLR